MIASCVLHVLDLILESGDITMIESSIPTFEAFCENHDPTSLFADQNYVKKYEAVVHAYADLASTKSTPSRAPVSKPLSMRWRNAGLEAIKSVISSDALSSLPGRQLQVIVPIILENLWSDNDDFLEALVQRVETEDKVEADRMTRRRTSIATVRTADTAGDANPIAISGTALDVDKLAEEDISVLALQCLKRVFVVPNRPQIHTATQSLLVFIEDKLAQGERVMGVDSRTGEDQGWAIQAFDRIARWAPVQDRFMILFTAMDALVQIPLEDKNLHRHIVLAAMIGSLLRSDVNLIGLSVMDVLMQLIQQMRRLLKLPLLVENGDYSKEDPSSSPDSTRQIISKRAQLLGRIEQCIGDLATHVYYADQIPDMVSAILHRLKPTRSSSTSSSPRLEHEEESTESADRPHHAEAYFSFSAAKISALRVVKAILVAANPSSRPGENRQLSRHRVPIQVWEGTHWLLRDPDGSVRKAYVDALHTWLELETVRSDFKVHQDNVPQRPTLKSNRDGAAAAFSRRGASNGSNHDKEARSARSRFLQLLHIAIYDNALHYVDYDSDYVLLHALLVKIVSRLGVNAVRFGLPMIYRLQEDIQDAETATQKVRLGSLVHGYFWILTEVFDFEDSSVGRAIINEIVRRRSKQFWVDGVAIPSPPIERIETPGASGPQRSLPQHEIATESLLPFDDRFSLVECIAVGYQETSISPAVSPAASPGRYFTQPMMDSTMGSSGTIAVTAPENELPESYRETMLVEWSRELAVLALQSASKSESLNGSKAGTSTNKQRLGVNGNGVNGHAAAGLRSPSPRGSHTNLRPASAHAAGSHGNLAPPHALRKSSANSNGSRSPSASSRHYIASVNELRRVLTGEASAPMPGTAVAADSDSTDSMVSYEGSPSELSFNPENRPTTVDNSQLQSSLQRRPSKGKSTGPLTSNPTHEEDEVQNGVGSSPSPDRVPPVPPLPKLRTRSTSRGGDANGLDSPGSPIASPTRALHSRGGRDLRSRGERRLASRGGESMRVSSMGESMMAGMDLQELLRSVDSRSAEASLGNLTRPPY